MAKTKKGRNNGVKDWSEKQVFTTGEAAEVCKVSQQTIIRCFDSGRLNGFRVPGSRFRRIPRVELLRFMKKNEIPTDIIDVRTTRRILVVDDDPEIVNMLKDLLSRDGKYEVAGASNGYDAGCLTESFKPDLVLLDYMLPDLNGDMVCQRLRANPALSDVKIIVISGVVGESDVAALQNSGADAFIKKPFEVQLLLTKMAELLNLPTS